MRIRDELELLQLLRPLEHEDHLDAVDSAVVVRRSGAFQVTFLKTSPIKLAFIAETCRFIAEDLLQRSAQHGATPSPLVVVVLHEAREEAGGLGGR